MKTQTVEIFGQSGELDIAVGETCSASKGLFTITVWVDETYHTDENNKEVKRHAIKAELTVRGTPTIIDQTSMFPIDQSHRAIHQMELAAHYTAKDMLELATWKS